MKKTTLAALFTITAITAIAQTNTNTKSYHQDSVSPAIHLLKEPRFLINLHKAYSVGMGSTFRFYPDDISLIAVTQDGTSTPYKAIDYANPTKGLGDGFKLGFGAAYILNDFINIGIDFDYFNSTIKKFRDSSFHHTNIPARNNSASEYTYTEHNSISYNATLLSLTPHITFKAISGGKWFVYNKLGAVITVRPNSLQEDLTSITSSTVTQGVVKDSTSLIFKKYEWSIRNPALGFMAALGIQTKLGEKWRGFAEVQFSHIVFIIRKRTLKDFIVDNIHLENSFPVSMRELEFVRSFRRTSGPSDPAQPSQTIIQRIPITYIGLQVGVAFQL
ncbi:MAG: hypothetical protein ABIN94_02620 [Ferruginibacter sp.]